jgi:hypothetical protein
VGDGEFVADEVESLMDDDRLVEAACGETVAHSRDRRAQDHSDAIRVYRREERSQGRDTQRDRRQKRRQRVIKRKPTWPSAAGDSPTLAIFYRPPVQTTPNKNLVDGVRARTLICEVVTRR